MMMKTFPTTKTATTNGMAAGFPAAVSVGAATVT